MLAFVNFFKTYTGHLAGYIGGSIVSAVLVLYGLFSGGKGLPLWAAFIVFVIFMVGTTMRVRREEVQRRLAVEAQREKERKEYLESVGILQKQLEDALENFDGCPQVMWGGYRKATASGFYLSITGADALTIELQPAESSHYRLTSKTISRAANGVPEVPLELHAELIAQGSGYTEGADGQEAWELYACDLWSSAHPIDTSKEVHEMFQQAYMNTLLVDNFPISVELSYLDTSGKRRYRSPAVIAWEPTCRSVYEVRQGPITKELI